VSWDFLGFSEAEGRAALEAVVAEKGKFRDGRICACGHSAQSHSALTVDPARQALHKAGIIDCRPSRMVCPCQKLVPVLEASDTRVFVRKTRGSGAQHALGLGVSAAMAAELGVTWLVERICWSCRQEGPVYPVAIDETGRLSERPQVINVLLCADCRLRSMG